MRGQNHRLDGRVEVMRSRLLQTTCLVLAMATVLVCGVLCVSEFIERRRKPGPTPRPPTTRMRAVDVASVLERLEGAEFELRGGLWTYNRRMVVLRVTLVERGHLPQEVRLPAYGMSVGLTVPFPEPKRGYREPVELLGCHLNRHFVTTLAHRETSRADGLSE